jgi:hypothetical protein
MNKTFKQRFAKYTIRLGALFVVLFVFRLIYGYVVTSAYNSDDYSDNFFNRVDHLRKNYASEKLAMKAPLPDGPQPGAAASQKYEKTATVRSKTTQFEKDVTAFQGLTKAFTGVIQYEQNTGNKGNRQVHWLIGINPDKFDSFYVKVQGIAQVKSNTITKIDKTNEYRQLNARKASLEKNLASLNELKSKGGVINDYITLHEKILELETQLQELGVELGNFDTENEFCTVRLSLYEGAPERKVSIMQRLKVALEWTIKYYAVLIVSLLALLGAGFLLLLVIDKLKVITNKFGE